MNEVDDKYLSPTAIIDSDHKEIIAYAKEKTRRCDDVPIEKAVRLYYAVRDDIWYDPYYPFYPAEHFRASNVLKKGRGYCVSKASLLCALGRASGIPSRVGFADVRNHLATRQLIEIIGTNLFAFHGFTEFYLEGKWVIATPAFNKELCERHKVTPLEFNGRDDSLLQPFNLEKKQFMEYVAYHGSFSDIPVDLIVAGMEKAYGKEKVKMWIDEFEKTGGRPTREFLSEEVIKT
jgi:transglutaminase-like putative cysteine protease